MTAVSVPSSDSAVLPGWVLRRGTGFYGLCLLTVFGGYYTYWIAWKLKAYFLGWVLCLAIVVVLALAGHLRLRGIVRDIAPVLAWYAYLLTSALWSPSTYDTLFLGSAALINVVVFIVAYSWCESTSSAGLSAYFEIQTIVLLPIIVYFLLTIGRLYDDNLGAVRTGFASTCLTALPFLIWRARHRPSVPTTATLAFASLMILTGESRSSLLVAPILGLGALLSVGRGKRSVGRSVAIVGGIAIGFAVIAMAIPAVRGGLASTVARFSGQTSFAVSAAVIDEAGGLSDRQVDIERRLQLFVALRSFVEHPLRGGGYQSTLSLIHAQFGWEVSAHGLPSTLLGETGLIGTAIFAWMIAQFYQRIRVASRREMNRVDREFLGTCKLAMLGFLGLGLFHQVDQNQSLYVLLAWGYAAARATPGSNGIMAGARPPTQ